ncbi:hypothetical protein OC498_13230 [Acinetobacter bohemicus]|uniref:Uncharacterized protein n=1 Tax=Acinetobacter junii TaxID=40215 RepID=A0AAW5RH70_ACIJU|nr:MULTISPECIES: hypothetical protein [Acinetobacter]MCH7381346.1 hypothetical protein [Acinetobacter higginsii]MCO8043553.1 hypothetical protein [Acinetobacter sp. S4400-12]MCU4398032.1 hypothetical protein [Acinetobacter junii]MCU7225842.1 hypothetical protein [Acinetobacter bohemicus]
MVDRVVSKDNAKKADESSVKNQKDEIIKDDYIQTILNGANQLPTKIVRTDQDKLEFLED